MGRGVVAGIVVEDHGFSSPQARTTPSDGPFYHGTSIVTPLAAEEGRHVRPVPVFNAEPSYFTDDEFRDVVRNAAS